MQKHRTRTIAKILILIPLIVIIALPICFVFAVLLEGPTNMGLPYLIFAVPFTFTFMFGSIPCLILSVVGTVFATKAKRAGEPDFYVWAARGFIGILLSSVWLFIIVQLSKTW